MKTLPRRRDPLAAMFPYIARRCLPLCVLLLAIAATPASAAVVYRSSNTTQNVSGSTSVTITKPAGVATGDLLIASVNSAGPVPTPPAGWSTIGTPGTLPWGGSAGTWYRIAGAGEPASYTWGLGASSVKAGGGMGAYAGASSTAPIADSQIAFAANSSTATSPSVSPVAANSLIVLGVAYDSTAPVTITPDPSTTSRWQYATSGAGAVKGGKAGEFLQAAATPTATKSYTASAVLTGWVTQSIAITPSGGSLSFTTAPNVPTLPAVTLNGSATTSSTSMANFTVDDEIGSLSGWNVTVAGNSAGGKSPVFAQYCPNATCATDTGPGYVPSGRTLGAGSLTLTSTGASFSGGARTAPSLTCASGCALDSGSPTKVASASVGAGAAAWGTGGFGASSLQLAIPTSLRVLKTNEVYRADLVWTLNSGP